MGEQKGDINRPSIILSEKHGVNPTICKCFFCGESKGVALLGKLPKDAKAPMYAVMDYEPCDACKEQMDQGLALIEVSTTQPADGRPAIQSNEQGTLYPLGRFLVMEPETFNQMTGKNFQVGDKCFVDAEIIDFLLKEAGIDE